MVKIESLVEISNVEGTFNKKNHFLPTKLTFRPYGWGELNELKD